jgi:hypothetical protein
MPYDPNQPIETLFQQIHYARGFVAADGHPFGDAMVAHITFTLVFNTDLFPGVCRAWQVRRKIPGPTSRLISRQSTGNFV